MSLMLVTAVGSSLGMDCPTKQPFYGKSTVTRVPVRVCSLLYKFGYSACAEFLL